MPKHSPRALAQYDFSVHIAPSGGEVVIDQDGDPSVTHDAEAVVADIAERMGGLGARPLIYRDSSGRYDGISHDGQQFLGFYPIGVTDESEALIHVDLGSLT
ncbi:hypothetical protein [Salinisphaera aquimarina]|uniref:Uncharacterized protein n=1 Tax=Salinisphaera aquimarina TaxID=2094031 RepID=A0ABV7EJM3_9GAMM